VNDGLNNMARAIEQRLQQVKTRIDALIRLFQAFNVQKTLDRGFALVRHNGAIVKQVAQVRQGDKINVQLAAGSIEADIASLSSCLPLTKRERSGDKTNIL